VGVIARGSETAGLCAITLFLCLFLLFALTIVPDIFIVKTEAFMNTVVLSSEYQVFIPEEIREKTGLKAGASLEVISYNNRIELIPIKPMKSLKGIFKGIDTTILREDDRI
jgi:AbrB family looped-hinge helix DNA binding protein